MAGARVGLPLRRRARVPGTLALLVVFGTARAFINPAAQSLVANLVRTEDLASAIAWNSSAWQIATILGPVTGGLIYGISAEAAYGTAVLLFAVSAVLACIGLSLACDNSGGSSTTSPTTAVLLTTDTFTGTVQPAGSDTAARLGLRPRQTQRNGREVHGPRLTNGLVSGLCRVLRRPNLWMILGRATFGFAKRKRHDDALGQRRTSHQA